MTGAVPRGCGLRGPCVRLPGSEAVALCKVSEPQFPCLLSSLQNQDADTSDGGRIT